MNSDTLLLIHAAATLMMTGLIWFVQIVHYPLMARVGREGFAAYEQAHTRRTTWVVMPTMLTELACAVLIASDPSVLNVSALAMLALIWVSTFALQVPMHAKLERGFSEHAHARLVSTNWIRTVLWSARSVLALLMLSPQGSTIVPAS